MDLYNASTDLEEDEFTHITLEEYEEQKASLAIVIANADKAKRLSQNQDFIDLVMTGYFTEEPERLASLLSSGKLPERNKQGCVAELDAIGRFRAYLQSFADQGATARSELEALEEARDERIKAQET